MFMPLALQTIFLMTTAMFGLYFITMSSDDLVLPSLNKTFNEWHSCMSRRMKFFELEPRILWKGFAGIVRYCNSHPALTRIEALPIENSDDVKYYIHSTNESDRSVVVSLGIGGDIAVEKRLQQELPKGSEFFGVDPIVQPNADLFKQVGKFFPIAVSSHNGNSISNVLEHGSYREMTVTHVDFITFLTTMVNRSRIDLLLMDNEGPEYILVPMVANDSILSRHNITICQVNVEFHQGKGRKNKFADVMYGIMESARFAVIRHTSCGHQRSFLVNYADPYCVRKYLQRFFTE